MVRPHLSMIGSPNFAMRGVTLPTAFAAVVPSIKNPGYGLRPGVLRRGSSGISLAGFITRPQAEYQIGARKQALTLTARVVACQMTVETVEARLNRLRH